MNQTLQAFITHVLPLTCAVCLTGVTVEPEDVRFQLTPTAPKAPCPGGAVPSSSLHSCYQRHLTDLPWGRHSVPIQRTVRKFVCRNPSCPRRIFTERVADLVAPYARKTQRRLAALQAIGGRPARTSARTIHESGPVAAASAPAAAGSQPAPACHRGR